MEPWAMKDWLTMDPSWAPSPGSILWLPGSTVHSISLCWSFSIMFLYLKKIMYTIRDNRISGAPVRVVVVGPCRLGPRIVTNFRPFSDVPEYNTIIICNYGASENFCLYADISLSHSRRQLWRKIWNWWINQKSHVTSWLTMAGSWRTIHWGTSQTQV